MRRANNVAQSAFAFKYQPNPLTMGEWPWWGSPKSNASDCMTEDMAPDIIRDTTLDCRYSTGARRAKVRYHFMYHSDARRQIHGPRTCRILFNHNAGKLMMKTTIVRKRSTYCVEFTFYCDIRIVELSETTKSCFLSLLRALSLGTSVALLTTEPHQAFPRLTDTLSISDRSSSRRMSDDSTWQRKKWDVSASKRATRHPLSVCERRSTRSIICHDGHDVGRGDILLESLWGGLSSANANYQDDVCRYHAGNVRLKHKTSRRKFDCSFATLPLRLRVVAWSRCASSKNVVQHSALPWFISKFAIFRLYLPSRQTKFAQSD